uniref:Putative hexapeptide repeat-containing transferase n=1 Tax=viral metagenome TaxID=1070528 RepID=A0A6M3LIU0_9ZZZZ
MDIVDISKYKSTCSIDYLKDKSITFVKKDGLIQKVIDSGLDIWVILQDGISSNEYSQVSMSVDAGADFIRIHNEINSNLSRREDIISSLAKISFGVQFTPGLKLVRYNDELLEMKHMGNIVIEDNVSIGTNTIIEYATLDSTIIRYGTKIDVACLVGHNAEIGRHTALATHTVIGGSAKIGDHCFLALGVVVRTHVTICDNVYIGMGAVVTKDISNPGMYYGVPAKYVKSWNGRDF